MLDCAILVYSLHWQSLLRDHVVMDRGRLNNLPQICDLDLFYFSLHSQIFALLLLNEVYAMMNILRIRFYQSQELNFQI